MPVKLIRQGDFFPDSRPTVVTTGTFDGVHLGHSKILERLCERARFHSGVSVVMSFEPHPRKVLFPDAAPVHMLSTIEEKMERLTFYGIDYLYLIPFTLEFSHKSSLEFIEQDIVTGLRPVCLVTGYDHHFGKDRQGSIDDLRVSGEKYGFEVEEIPALDLDQVAVSSSIIRKALMQGDVHTAARYLGYPYTLSGLVVAGDRLGRTLGFPTANLSLAQNDKLIPSDGVYACRVEVDAIDYACMLNIGNRPTFQGIDRRIEAHLIGFSGDLYGKMLRVFFVERIRDEMKFSGAQALISQLEKDLTKASELLSD